MIKVSVIVPVWNVEKYLEKCLESLVNQTLKDIEIIVVNDDSPDDSQKIIDKYKEKYPDKIISLFEENSGQGEARNYGLTKAHGEYIGYVDSDDYIKTDMYEKMYQKAKEEDLDVVVCQFINVYENSSREDLEIVYDDTTLPFTVNVSVWNKIYKRDILKNIKFKSKVWYEDLAFTTKTILNSKNIGYVNEGLYYYLKREGSTMNNNSIKRNLEILDAFDDVLEYLKNNKKYQNRFDEIEYSAIFHIYISTITRVINIKTVSMKEKKKIINELVKYMKDKFPNFKKNKYIHLLARNKKIVFNLLNAKQYRLVGLIFKVKEMITR